jgi:hypothetical protein
MQKFLGLLIFFTALFSQANILQGQKIQLQCKEKAKEIAQSTYTSCLNEARETELDKVKQDYKEKMEKLKSYYNKKIKTLTASDDDNKKTSKHSTSEFPNLPEEKKPRAEEPIDEQNNGDT